MKKLSKIFAVVLCLALVLAVLPMGASAATEKHVEFTVESLGLASQAYTASTATVDGVAVEWIELGNYGNGIQMRDKVADGGKASMFWNTSAVAGNITKIEFTYSDSKKAYADNNIIVNFGNEAKGADCAKTLVTEKDVKSYTITPDGDYTFFYIEWDSDYSSYWKSIKVYYSEAEAEVTTNYYVAGVTELCGSFWTENDANNIMTKGGDGLYTKVYENVAAGSYELKVTDGTWTNSWGNNGGNYVVTVDSESTVTVIFNAEAKTVSVEVVANEEPTTVDIATALAGENGTEFTVKGSVTLIDGKNVYLQDSTGGICVRASANVEDLALGDVVIGTGSKSVYNGLPQLGGSYEKVSSGKLTAKDVTIDGLTTADVGTYVKLSGVTVTEVYDKNGEYSSPNITVTDGTNTIQIYKAQIYKNDDDAWTVAVDDVIDVYAAVGIYSKNDNTTLQLRNSLPEEIVAAGSEAPSFVGKPAGGNVNTGDMPIAGLVVAMMAAAGCAVVLSKKKEF